MSLEVEGLAGLAACAQLQVRRGLEGAARGVPKPEAWRFRWEVVVHLVWSCSCEDQAWVRAQWVHFALLLLSLTALP